MNAKHILIGEILAKHPDLTQEEEIILNDWLAEDIDNEKIFNSLTETNAKLQLLIRLNELKTENERCWNKLTAVNMNKSKAIFHWLSLSKLGS